MVKFPIRHYYVHRHNKCLLVYNSVLFSLVYQKITYLLNIVFPPTTTIFPINTSEKSLLCNGKKLIYSPLLAAIPKLIRPCPGKVEIFSNFFSSICHFQSFVGTRRSFRTESNR